MQSVYPWKIRISEPQTKLRITLFFFCLLLMMNGRAQDTTAVRYPWNVIEMTDYRMKPGVVWIKVPPPKGGTPIWIPISGGIIVTGGVVYLLTDDQNSGPDLPPDCTFTVNISTTPADCGLSNGSAEAIVDEPGEYSYLWSDGSTLSTANGLAAGPVSVTVTGQNGQCTTSAVGTIEQLATDYIDNSSTLPGNCLGEGADILLTTSSAGSGPMTVVINGEMSFNVPSGEVSLASFTELLPGTYELAVYDSSIGTNCTQSLTLSIPDNTQEPTAVVDNFTTPFQTVFSGNVLDNDDGMNINLTAVDQVLGGTVSFTSNGQFTFAPFPDFVGEGSFTYTLTDACGQTATAVVIVNVLPPDCTFTVSISTIPADCGLSNGNAEAIVDEPGEYTYLWSDGSTLSTANGLAAGPVSVTVTGQNGQCTTSAVSVLEELAADYINNSSTLPGNCLGEGADILLTTSTPGSGPMTIVINGEMSFNVPSGEVSLASFTELLPGTYELTVYDSSIGTNCTQSLTLSIPDNTQAPTAVADNFTTPFQTVFSGNVLDNDAGLNVNLTAVDQVLGGTVSFTSNGQFTFDPLPDFVGEGSFTYTLTDACGQTATATVVINVLPPDCTFTVSISTTPADCGLSNGSAEATVDEPGEYSYAWSDGSTLSTANGLAAGPVSVTVTGQNGQCTTSAVGTIEQLATDYIDNSSTLPGNCLGEGADILLTTSTPGSGPMTIVINGEMSFNVPSGEVSLASFTELFPGTYELTIYDSSIGTNCTQTLTLSIADNTQTPTAVVDNFTTPFQTPLSGNVLDNDAGLNVNLTAVDQVLGGTISFTSNGQFTFDPFPDFVGEGSFTYTLTDACGQTATATVVINVLPPDCTFTVSISTTPADCGLSNGSAEATVDEPGEYSYLWSDGSTLSTANGLAAGSVSVTVTGQNGQCTTSAVGTIEQLATDYIDNSSALPGNCLGEGADILLTTSSAGSGPLTIILNGELVTDVPLGEVALSSWFELLPGDFTLTLFDSTQGETCTETITGTIADNTPTPQATNEAYTTPYGITFSDNVLDNDTGLNLSLTDISDIVGGTVSYMTNGSFTFLPAEGFSGMGGFSYTVMDACGQLVTAEVSITVEEPNCSFSIFVDPLAAHCGLADGSAFVEVDEPGTYTFEWSDGQTGSTATGLPSGNYSVTAMEPETGCIATLDFTIEELPSQYISELTVIAPHCGAPGDIQFFASTEISPALIVSVNHPDGITTFFVEPGLVVLSEHLPTVPGDYTITVQDPEQGAACAETVSVIIPEAPPGPSITLLESLPPSGPSASDGALVILIEPYTFPPFDILLNGVLWGSTEGEVFTIGDLSAGEYAVQVVDELGCTSNVIETILSFTQPLVSWETQWGVPTIPGAPATSAWVEHPPSLPATLGAGVSSQLTYQRGSKRAQLICWSYGGQVAGQAIQLNWQKGIQGRQWSFFNGPAMGFFRSSSSATGMVQRGTYLYWASDLGWRPQSTARWTVEIRTAVRPQQQWQWAADLRIKFRW